LDNDQHSTGKVVVADVRRARGAPQSKEDAKKLNLKNQRGRRIASSGKGKHNHNPHSTVHIRRRHPADETAHLLALSVKCGVRCIAFASTRSLVEWVYDKCLKLLKQDPTTSHLASKVESYRGGYTMDVRRSIEQRLFSNEILGVVGTCALELGVDIGGIDLTLHCGYPGSYTSLMQQAGRAGRGGASSTEELRRSSFAIIVCWNSPSEQHLWQNAPSVLSQSQHTAPCIPIDATLLKGHLLCAAFEFPLVGNTSLGDLLNDAKAVPAEHDFSDCELLGPHAAPYYKEAVRWLLEKGHASTQVTKSIRGGADIRCVRSHPSMTKPWAQISIRAIEPLQYSIVDLNHPLQGRSMDGIKSKKAVLDTISYSRIFYHCFPGAIIMHRAKKYKVQSLAKPPTYLMGNSTASGGGSYSGELVAYVIPTKAAYSTRALQLTFITIVKRLESIVLPRLLSDNNNIIMTESDRKIPVQGEEKDPVKSAGIVGEQVVAPAPASAPAAARLNSGEHLQDPARMAKRPPLGHVGAGTRRAVGEGEGDADAIVDGPVAGNGVVTVRRQVWGYAKLSPVTRAEMSRTEIALPPLEFDTNAFWMDAEASALRHLLPNDQYDHGIHALSHALVAIAPLYTSCTSSDIDCDHSLKGNTKVLIFDSRPGGGTHTTEQMWRQLHVILPAALNMLEYCPTCSHSPHVHTKKQVDADMSHNLDQNQDAYADFGCPSCLQGISCTKFHEGLSRRAALVIGRRMLARLEKTEFYQTCQAKSAAPCTSTNKRGRDEAQITTPSTDGSCSSAIPRILDGSTSRRVARARALSNCKDLAGAKTRQFVIGRPSWPMDIMGGAESGLHSRNDNDFETYIVGPAIAGAAGYMPESETFDLKDLQMPE
jgi:ATP-dependent helicase YprA (DUF1998 family)